MNARKYGETITETPTQMQNLQIEFNLGKVLKDEHIHGVNHFFLKGQNIKCELTVILLLRYWNAGGWLQEEK